MELALDTMSKAPCIRPSVCFEVQKIIGVSIGEGNTRNYHVQWAPTWINSTNLLGCEHLIDEFNNRRNRCKNDFEDNAMAIDRESRCPSPGDNTNHKVSSSSRNAEFYTEPNNFYDSFTSVTSDDEGSHTTSFAHNMTNEGVEYTKVICMDDDNDVPNDMIDLNTTTNGTFEKNPNFEWRRIENRELKEDDEQTLPGTYDECEMSDQGLASHSVERTVDIDDEEKEKDHYSIDNDREVDSPIADPDDRLINTSTEDLEDQKITIKTETADVFDEEDPNSNSTSHTTHSITDIKPGAFKNRNYPLWTEHTYFHSGKRIYECMLCNTTFSTKGNLTTHFKLHTGYKPYQCLECNKFFSRKHHLTDHLRLHTGEKPFTCSYCHKAFTRNHHLKDHVRVHHKEDEIPTMASDVCGAGADGATGGAGMGDGDSVLLGDTCGGGDAVL